MSTDVVKGPFVNCPACGEPQRINVSPKAGRLNEWAKAISDGTPVQVSGDDLDYDLIPVYEHMLQHNDAKELPDV